MGQGHEKRTWEREWGKGMLLWDKGVGQGMIQGHGAGSWGKSMGKGRVTSARGKGMDKGMG